MQTDHDKLASMAERYHLDLIVLWGSWAKERVKPDSDVDVAVRGSPRDRREGETLEPWEWELEVMEALAETIQGGDLDVAFLHRGRPLFLFEVARTGVLLYEREPGGFARFKSYAARLYYDNVKLLERRWESLRKWYQDEQPYDQVDTALLREEAASTNHAAPTENS